MFLIAATFALAAVAMIYWDADGLRRRATEWLVAGRRLVELADSGATPPRVVEREDALSTTARPAPGPDVAPSVAEPAGAASPPDKPESPSIHTPADKEAGAAEATSPPVPPPAPETLEPESRVVVVSKGAPSAVIAVRRHGGALASSSVIWWTSDGTAVANEDYVDLGARIAKFAAGQEVQTIYIPIIHDSKAEGRETFYVNLRAGQNENSREPIQRVEVIIDDDDHRPSPSNPR